MHLDIFPSGISSTFPYLLTRFWWDPPLHNFTTFDKICIY